MGTIINTFTNIELDCKDPVEGMEKVKTCARDAGLPEDRWAMNTGSNFSLFITVFPTGSKVGWKTSQVHNTQVVDFLMSLEEAFEFVAVAKATTTSD